MGRPSPLRSSGDRPGAGPDAIVRLHLEGSFKQSVVTTERDLYSLFWAGSRLMHYSLSSDGSRDLWSLHEADVSFLPGGQAVCTVQVGLRGKAPLAPCLVPLSRIAFDSASRLGEFGLSALRLTVEGLHSQTSNMREMIGSLGWFDLSSDTVCRSIIALHDPGIGMSTGELLTRICEYHVEPFSFHSEEASDSGLKIGARVPDWNVESVAFGLALLLDVSLSAGRSNRAFEVRIDRVIPDDQDI